MEVEEALLPVSLKTGKREHEGKEYTNLYIVIDDKRFELVPHCRTIKETAYFYSMLEKAGLPNM